jgi:phage major head subunit gpT-like protein
MEHPEKLMINLLTGGTSGLAYDGVAFFSDATGARTIDNLLAGSGTTLAQLETDLNAALTAMAKFKDDQGESLNIRGNLIICPKALENTFNRLVNSQTDPTASAQGTFNPYSGKFTVIGDARLDAVDANDWYLLATNEIVKPFVFSMRQEAEPLFEKTPLTKQWVASANYRGNAGYGIPHLAIKTVNT